MNIVLNGKDTVVNNSSTLLSIIEEKGINPASVVAEVDGTIYKTDEFANGVTRSTPKTVGITDKSVA